MNQAFWENLEKLAGSCEVVIDRPKGSRHPRFPHIVYEIDYGYLKGTHAMDGSGVDVWRGTDGDEVTGIVCTVDLMKKDAEIKILIGCSEEEMEKIERFHNESDLMKGLLIRRPSEK